MKHNRLPWLLLVVAALLLLRWLAPLRPSTEVDVVQATDASTVATDAAALKRTPAPLVPEASGSGQPTAPPVAVEPGAIGNAFSVRRPPQAVASIPVAAATVAQAPADPPPTEAIQPAPPPPPPPLQVIGTWDDGVSPGVFIATPQSTVLARKDTVLMADYKVVAITAQTVSLLQLSSQLPWSLPVPQNAPPSSPKAALAAKPPTRSAP